MSVEGISPTVCEDWCDYNGEHVQWQLTPKIVILFSGAHGACQVNPLWMSFVQVVV